MKFQLKVIVAAVAFATSLPALAQLAIGGGGNDGVEGFGGNSSFVLTAFDPIANVMATFDLGKQYFDFNQVSQAGTVGTLNSFSLNFASQADYSPAWSSFIQAATVPNIRWAVAASDNYAGFDAENGFDFDITPGSLGYITSYSSIGTPQQNETMQQALGLFDPYINGENFQGHTAADGSKFTANATAAKNQYIDGFFSSRTTGANALGLLNNSLNIAQYTYNGPVGSGLLDATRTIVPGTFTLTSGGLFTYTAATAPIPEADTWAMMLLGLGFMGFVARRKQA